MGRSLKWYWKGEIQTKVKIDKMPFGFLPRKGSTDYLSYKRSKEGGKRSCNLVLLIW